MLESSPITRINHFRAKPGQAGQLMDFLAGVMDTIHAAQGCVECVLLVDHADPQHLVIVERWHSVQDHQNAAALIPRERIMAVMQYLEGPVAGEYLAPIAG